MDQDQKRRLKRILSILRLPENRAADTQNHRPMTFNKSRECQLGALVGTGSEPFQ